MSGHRSVEVTHIVDAIHERNRSNPALNGCTEAEIISSVFETISEQGPNTDVFEIGQQAIAAIAHGLAWNVLVATEDSKTGEVRYNVITSSKEKEEARLIKNLCLADLGLKIARQNASMLNNISGPRSEISVRDRRPQQSNRRMCNQQDQHDANVASGSGVRSSRKRNHGESGGGKVSVARSSMQPGLRDVVDECVGNYKEVRKGSKRGRRAGDGGNESDDSNEEDVGELAEEIIKRNVAAIKNLQLVHALQHGEGQTRYNLRKKTVVSKVKQRCALSNDRLKAKHFSDDESENEYGLAYRNCEGRKKIRKDVDAKAAANIRREDKANAKKHAAKQKGRGRSNRRFVAAKGRGRKARTPCRANAARQVKRKKSIISSDSSKDRQKPKRRKTKKVLTAKRKARSARSSSDEGSCEPKKKTPAKRNGKAARSSSDEGSCGAKKKTPAKRNVKAARSSSDEGSCEPKKKTPAKRNGKAARCSSEEESLERKKKTQGKRKGKAARSSSDEGSCEKKNESPAKQKGKPARSSSSDEPPGKNKRVSKAKKQVPEKGKGNRQRFSCKESERSSSRSSDDSAADSGDDSCSSRSSDGRSTKNRYSNNTNGNGYHCNTCGSQFVDYYDRFPSGFKFQQIDHVIEISDDDNSVHGSKNTKKKSKTADRTRGKSNKARRNRNPSMLSGQESQEEDRVEGLFKSHSKGSKSTQIKGNAHASKTVECNLDDVAGQSQIHQIDDCEFVHFFKLASKSNSDTMDDEENDATADQDGNMLTCDDVDPTTGSECIQKPQNEGMFVDASEENREHSTPQQIPRPLTPAPSGIPHHLMMNTLETLHAGGKVSGGHSLIHNTDITNLARKRETGRNSNARQSSVSTVAAVDEDVDATTVRVGEGPEIAAEAESGSLSLAETVEHSSTCDGDSKVATEETSGEGEPAISEKAAGEGVTGDEEKSVEKETVSSDSKDKSGNTEKMAAKM